MNPNAFDLIDGIRTYKLFIDGQWVRSSRNDIVDDLNPANGAVFARVQQAGPEEVERFLEIRPAGVAPEAPPGDYDRIGLDAFQVISDWYHLAIVELANTPDFRGEPYGIARSLGISVVEARAALERLLRLGMLARSDSGCIRGTGKTVHHDFRRRARDLGALAGFQFDQAHLLQMEQRLAHGRAPDAELLGQFALGRQRVAGLQRTIADHRLEARGDILIEPTALHRRGADRGKGHLVYLSYQQTQNASESPRNESMLNQLCGAATVARAD